MKIIYRGLAAALLCAVLTGSSGCRKDEPLYTAGLTAAEDAEAAGETADTAKDAGAEDGEAGSLPKADTAWPAAETESAGCVYVCGAVAAPGVYEILEGMRICDAVAMAGGFLPEADQEWLNQAQRICDGQKIYVYTREETLLLKEAGLDAEGEGEGTGTAAQEHLSGSRDGRININTATREELMTLPGIGEAKADAILQYRGDHGSFSAIEEIQNISGIKSGVFSKIRDLITV